MKQPKSISNDISAPSQGRLFNWMMKRLQFASQPSLRQRHWQLIQKSFR